MGRHLTPEWGTFGALPGPSVLLPSPSSGDPYVELLVELLSGPQGGLRNTVNEAGILSLPWP